MEVRYQLRYSPLSRIHRSRWTGTAYRLPVRLCTGLPWAAGGLRETGHFATLSHAGDRLRVGAEADREGQAVFGDEGGSGRSPHLG
jgi:hypothetical protein